MHGHWATIVAGPALRPEVVNRTVALWESAVIVSLAPYPLFVLLTAGVFFVFAPYVEGLALALAVMAYAVGRRLGFRMAPFAVVLLAITVGMTAYASLAWSTTPTCGGGLSGPCFSPFLLCGLGLISAIVATILVAVGVARLRRVARGPGVPPA